VCMSGIRSGKCEGLQLAPSGSGWLRAAPAASGGERGAAWAAKVKHERGLVAAHPLYLAEETRLSPPLLECLEALESRVMVRSRPRNQAAQMVGRADGATLTTRAQSRLMAPSTAARAREAARRAKEVPGCSPWPSLSHRACQMAPSVATRSLVQRRWAGFPTGTSSQRSGLSTNSTSASDGTKLMSTSARAAHVSRIH
jgi:hypothetical protein